MVSTDKVGDKMRSDPELIATTMMINPEPLGEMSPTLPEGFPWELIPVEKCELLMGKLVKCLIDNEYDNVKCEEDQVGYYKCKNWRDTLLFQRIKDWEKANFKKASDDDKDSYLKKLKEREKFLLTKYEEVPMTPANKGKRDRIASDILQIKVRKLNLMDSV